MPTVAQKLCQDIVEPVLKHSNVNKGKLKSNNKFSNPSSTARHIHNDAKPMRYVHIDKKTSSKTETSHTSGMTIVKSKTSVLKSLGEAAVNTLVSGPLKCDNNCVTLVRKRDNQAFCKCGQKRINAVRGKSIQTLNKKDFCLTDKACTNCVETVTCGTQFKDKTNMLNNGKRSKSNIALKLPGKVRDWPVVQPSSEQYPDYPETFKHHLNNSMNYMSSSLRYVNGKRWALSSYPKRGPDF